MIKFRQFILESKKKKKKLTPHELKHGVATHFSHSDNRKTKKKINEDILSKIKSAFSSKPQKNISTSYDHAMHTHLSKNLPNTHIIPAPDYETDDHITKMYIQRHHAENVDHELSKRYPYENLPHKGVVRKYTEESRDLNDELYKDHLHGTGVSKYHKLDQLDQATTHHTLTHPLTVYSGVTKRVPEDAAKHPERKVYHPGFVSSSLDGHVATDFSKPITTRHDDGQTTVDKHILRIHLKPGHKILHVGRHSEFGHEREVILPRGKTFKLSDKPETHHIVPTNHTTPLTNGKSDKLHIWDAHIVDGSQ